MFRSIVTLALFLRKYRIGEIHKGVVMLTSDSGLIHAIAHGALKEKSRLRTATEPVSHSKVYLYRDPVKDTYKVSDIEPIDNFEGIRTSLVKFYVVSLWSEVVMRSFGGGTESDNLYVLLLECMRLLDAGQEAEVDYVSLQFMWRFLESTGSKPDVAHCAQCGRFLDEAEVCYLASQSGQLYCRTCHHDEGMLLTAGARMYLQRTLAMPLTRAATVRLEGRSASALKRVLYQLVQAVLEVDLNTIRSGAGII